MKAAILTLVSLLSCAFALAQSPPTPEEVLDNAIQYHDPEGLWPRLKTRLVLEEKRAGGAIRSTTVWIDNTRGFFKVNRNDQEIHGMVLDSCFIELGEADCARAATMRNYYLYLWGLPMKLKDRGTRMLDEVKEVDWVDYPAYELTVVYDTDSWNFYFDKKNFRMIGYQFYHNDGTGEKIILTGEKDVLGMKIPRERSWYVLPGQKYLGTDVLVRNTVF